MNRFMKFVPMALAGCLLYACSSVNYTTTRFKLYPPTPEGTKVKVYKQFEKTPKNVDVIGKVEYEGASGSCTIADMESVFKEQARELGGEAVRIVFVREPDGSNPCYRGSADVIRTSEHSIMVAYKDSLKAEEQKKIEEEQKREADKLVAKDPVLVAIVETMGNDVAQSQETQYLTNVLREEAVKILRADLNYTIMTRENILAVLPADKSLEDGEGDNLIETGRNISAQYIGQAKVSAFGDEITISVEMYSTADGKLLTSFNAKKSGLDLLEKEIREKAPAMFEDIMKKEMSKKQ